MNGLSILIPIKNRATLLDNTLNSYLTYNDLSKINYEIIVLSNNTCDNLKDILKKYNNLNIILKEYQYHDNIIDWCNPAYAFNLGAKMARYSKIALTSPEIKHTTNIIEILSKELNYDAILCKTLDQGNDGSLIELYSTKTRGDNPGFYFFGAYDKNKFLSIGGLDEDFMEGVGWEDTEFGERWLRNKFNHIVRDDLICIHQFHPRFHQNKQGYKNNNKIYLTKKNQLKANVNK